MRTKLGLGTTATVTATVVVAAVFAGTLAVVASPAAAQNWGPSAAEPTPDTPTPTPTTTPTPDPTPVGPTTAPASGTAAVAASSSSSSSSSGVPADAPAAQPGPERIEIGLKSYGRVGIITTTDWRPPLPLNIVAHGPRWQQGPYQELTFWARETPKHAEAGPLPWAFEFTLAFNEKLFHYTGEWEIGAAIRNLYVQARPTAGLDVWIGSRMYRGQDVYLFDWWPVHDLNTVGAGFGLNLSGQTEFAPDDTRLMAHIGFNRLINDPYIFQTVDLPHPSRPGTRTAIYLERQKFIASATAQHWFGGEFLAQLHAEVHALPSGEWLNPSDSLVYDLPAEAGIVVGAMATFRMPTADAAPTSVHIFARLGLGAAAYNTLGVPLDRDTDRGLGNALEFVTGASAAIELGFMGVHVAAAIRRFQDADQQTDFDLDDRTEISIAVRPEFYLDELVRVGFEISWQRFVSDGIFSASGRTEGADEWQFTLFAALNAGNAHLFQRPQLRLFATLAVLTDPAREWLGTFVLYDQPRTLNFLLGLQAEWWFG